MPDAVIGHVRFTDGARRPVYAECGRQYTYDNDGEQVYGVFLIPREEWADLPVIVQGLHGQRDPRRPMAGVNHAEAR
ncbi:MAG TPA: hypothetical protein VG013_17185 [Gemmataceae bacterium]|jgi:hypothetical protein|nr:hypothetical protein [Gemmataceae bacterium]